MLSLLRGLHFRASSALSGEPMNGIPLCGVLIACADGTASLYNLLRPTIHHAMSAVPTTTVTTPTAKSAENEAQPPINNVAPTISFHTSIVFISASLLRPRCRRICFFFLRLPNVTALRALCIAAHANETEQDANGKVDANDS